jgi:uncharacterized protein (DUF952 family)
MAAHAAVPLFHLVPPQEWPQDGDYRPASLAAEGFVHFSFAEQVEASANRHFAQAVELVAVEVDPVKLDVPIRVEDSYGSGIAHPHVYGAVPVVAAVAMHPLHRDPTGRWIFSPADDAPGRA